MLHARTAVLRTAALVVIIAAALTQPAAAVSRSCGSDPVANTTNVLCAAPSGPCNGSSVTFSTNVEVTSGACTFDLQGRDLTIDKTLQMRGDGAIIVDNAATITITSTGTLKARGDFDVPGGTLISGGVVILNSSNTITHHGLIDVYGDPGGSVHLRAGDDITVSSTGAIRGVGDSTGGTNARFADGGNVQIISYDGDVSIAGDIYVKGQSQAQGGDILIEAARSLSVSHAIEASGGAGGGGTISLTAADNLDVSKELNAESNSGGGPGGSIALAAGEDTLGGAITGGSLTVQTGNIQVDGSSATGTDDDGGSFRASAAGSILIASTTAVHASAGNSTSGDGGDVAFDAGTNITIQGPISASGGSFGGAGGTLSLSAGGNVTFASSGDATLTGSQQGGAFNVRAGGTYTQGNQVLVNGIGTGSEGGSAAVSACGVTLSSNSHVEGMGTLGGEIDLIAQGAMSVSTTAQVKTTGTKGRIELRTKTFGTCGNDPTRHCRQNSDCTIGCNTGTCQNINPNTGGVVTQFSPAPIFNEDPTLPACP